MSVPNYVIRNLQGELARLIDNYENRVFKVKYNGDLNIRTAFEVGNLEVLVELDPHILEDLLDQNPKVRKIIDEGNIESRDFMLAIENCEDKYDVPVEEVIDEVFGDFFQETFNTLPESDKSVIEHLKNLAMENEEVDND